MQNIDLNEPMTFTVRNDYAFKKIFGSEENRDILTEFICLVTGMDKDSFDELTVENTELQTKFYDSKAGRLDIKIRLKDGQKVDIEMQNIWFPEFAKRSIFYWAELFTEDFKKGSDYYDLNRCIAINIVNEPFKLNESMHSIYKIMETKTHKLLDEALEIHFLDLTKIPREKRNKLENWLLFIQTDEQEVRDMLSKKDNQLKRANSQMQEFYSVDEQRAQYIKARNAESDRVSLLGASRREGFSLGVLQGKREGMKEAASAFKDMGLPVDQIIKATGLSLEEIEKL